jgi:hypothetical protein
MISRIRGGKFPGTADAKRKTEAAKKRCHPVAVMSYAVTLRTTALHFSPAVSVASSPKKNLRIAGEVQSVPSANRGSS